MIQNFPVNLAKQRQSIWPADFTMYLLNPILLAFETIWKYCTIFYCPMGTQLQPTYIHTYIHIHSMVFKNAHMGCLSDLSINFFSSWIAHTSKVCSSQPLHNVSFSEFLSRYIVNSFQIWSFQACFEFYWSKLKLFLMKSEFLTQNLQKIWYQLFW
jgi:hypothetical protein